MKSFGCLFCFIKTSTKLYEEKTSMKRYLLQSAKNDVLENTFVLLQRTKVNQSQCILRKFFCQILLCSSIHSVSGFVEIQGDAMADYWTQNGIDVFSFFQLFVLVLLCCDLCTDQLNGLRQWFCNQAG